MESILLLSSLHLHLEKLWKTEMISEFLSLRLILLQEITKGFPPRNLFFSSHLSSGNPGHVTALYKMVCSYMLTLLQSRVCFWIKPSRRFSILSLDLLKLFMDHMYRFRKNLGKLIPIFFLFSKMWRLSPAYFFVSLMRIGSAGLFLFFLHILLGEALLCSENRWD